MNVARFRFAAALAAVLGCVACGNKGSLYLPGEPPAATTGNQASAEAPASTDEPAPAPPDDEREDRDRGS